MQALRPFSLARALRITAPVDPMETHSGFPLRIGRNLPLETLASDRGAASGRRLPLETLQVRLSRLERLESMRLLGPVHTVADGGPRLHLTYVMRDSMGAARWCDSRGAAVHLAPGELFVSQLSHDSLVEMSPAVFGDPCDCIQLVLRVDSTRDFTVRREPGVISYCNSVEACVRVMLGSYRDHYSSIHEVNGMNLFDIDLAPYSELEIPIEARRWGLAILTSGSLQFGGSFIESTCAIAFTGDEPFARIATQSGASILWLDVPYFIGGPVSQR